MNKPNTFLIGVQKAATTSVFNWLSQHPEVCAPLAMKDLAFFTRPVFYRDKGLEYLLGHYKNCNSTQKIKLQGSVHYIFFENALKRIQRFCPDAKFILILRQPIDRAISSYKYARKFDYEALSFHKAINEEDKRMRSNDIRTVSECTYINHGFYAFQIERFLKYFKRDQLKILLYEDIKDKPEKSVRDLYGFLDVCPEFKPRLESHNKTGGLRSKSLQKLFFGDHLLKKGILNIITNLLSEEQKAKLRWKLIHLNTSNNEEKLEIDQELINRLNSNFEEDIIKLEKLIERDLSHWKQTPIIK